MAYVSLGSRSRPLMSNGGGSGTRGGSGGGSGGGAGTGVLERWRGHQHDGNGPIRKQCSSSESMKPPPGKHAPSVA